MQRGVWIFCCLVNPTVVFWQWVNHSFNALVNYTNRNTDQFLQNPGRGVSRPSKDAPTSLSSDTSSSSSGRSPRHSQIGVAYVAATSTALVPALGLNLYTKKAPPLVARWVPFADVAAANCVNIYMMRQ
ncbi:hypothetical protein CRENBAI_007325, partial [Crenichthys baileyi]